MRFGYLLTGLAVSLCLAAAMRTDIFPVLASAALAGRQTGDYYLVVTNQLLRPAGDTFAVRGRPVELATDAAGKYLAVLSQSSVMLRDGATGAPRAEIRTKTTSYTGLAFRPGADEVWASEATRNGPDSVVILFPEESAKSATLERIELTGHPVPTGIAFSADGKSAYVALSRTGRVAVIDTQFRRIVREIPVGLAPHGVLMDVKRNRLYVSNRGGRTPAAGQSKADSAGTMLAVDPNTGSTLNGTVSVIDLRTFAVVRDVEVGRAPSGLSLSPDGSLLVVANGHSDSLTLIDTQSLAARDVAVPTRPAGMFGAQPVASAFSPEGDRLYVLAAGDNSVSVLKKGSGTTWTPAGAMPTGWFPVALLVDSKGDLRVASVKGTGGNQRAEGNFNTRQWEGQLARITKPTDAQLAAGAEIVEAANAPRFTPAGGVENLASLGIRHAFLIIKENRTYDQVFGDMPRGNNDPKLAIYGRDVTPNHHALAEQFVQLDNFYDSGSISFDGHQWLMQGFVSDYVERAMVSAPRGYAWNLADALTVSPQGFFWQNAPRPLDVKLFGATSLPLRWDPATQRPVDIDENELLPWKTYWDMYKKKTYRDAVGARAGVPALDPLMVKRYPASSMRIPDQIRADIFLDELAKWEKSGKAPDLSVFTMTSDHTVGTTPDNPTPAAMVADNDLALGRMVAGIAKSRFWQQSVIFVVEDDAQDGIDHVDGHRTVALVIGPHVRRKALDSNFYTQGSMIRSIQEIFRVQPRTRYLANSRSMTSVFQAKPEAARIEVLTPKIPLDTMNPPLKALSGKRLLAARRSAAMNWDEIDDVPSGELNKILWWDAKGYDAPLPPIARRR
ncbi:MAG: bifunctional YncE family protein/alkaline phosphatase family protein [Bryobacteraceae bacterium]|nr:bifunctional YncE family protein/alkaline phosphatase family protein [Bryobacteraceae bacterium]